ncbi:cytochrome P450 [Geopyxis carbonaria]|nr:cytochrome P450 [Geopyxis carbonaria]
MAVLSTLTLTPTSALLTALALLLVHTLSRIIYNLYLHPLRHVPGPLLARCSHWWEFYYDIVHPGTRVKQLPALHEKYGPVVRVSPREVAVLGAKAHTEVFKPAPPAVAFPKDPGFYSTIGPSTASLTFLNPHASRTRRALLGPLFSRRAITTLEPLIVSTTTTLLTKLRQFTPDAPVPLQYALYATTIDAISAYCFGPDACLNVLAAPGFRSQRLEELLGVSDGVWIGYHVPWLQGVVMALPRSISRRLAPGAIGLIENCEALVTKHLAALPTAAPAASDTGDGEDGTKTVFDVLTSPTLTKSRVPPFSELVDEAIILLLAGTDTTANTLTFAVYYFLTHPECAKLVLAELDALAPGSPDASVPLAKLEQCKYFTAFLKETLRFSHGVPGKSPRAVPAGGWTTPTTPAVHLPEGTAVGFAPSMLHRDPEVFPNPEKFEPERWLRDESGVLDGHLFSFSKGPRGCLGERLAWAEMYLVLGHLLRACEMELYDTDESTVEWRDMGIAHTKGKVQVRIRGWRGEKA